MEILLNSWGREDLYRDRGVNNGWLLMSTPLIVVTSIV